MQNINNIIEENNNTKSPYLDLTNSGLTEFPKEILKLKHLKEINFDNTNGRNDNTFTTIPLLIQKLKNLKSISLHSEIT
jgi:Leucine-rich repeat (LRR) protein